MTAINAASEGPQEAAGSTRQPARSRRRRRASDEVHPLDGTPKRRRLRDLPVRRAAASLATATSTAAASVERVVVAPPANEASDTTKACPVCLTNSADVALIPCGHCVCVRCIDQITSMPSVNPDNPQPKTCPVCRIHIRDKLRLHFVL